MRLNDKTLASAQRVCRRLLLACKPALDIIGSTMPSNSEVLAWLRMRREIMQDTEVSWMDPQCDRVTRVLFRFSERHPESTATPYLMEEMDGRLVLSATADNSALLGKQIDSGLLRNELPDGIVDPFAMIAVLRMRRSCCKLWKETHYNSYGLDLPRQCIQNVVRQYIDELGVGDAVYSVSTRENMEKVGMYAWNRDRDVRTVLDRLRLVVWCWMKQRTLGDVMNYIESDDNEHEIEQSVTNMIDLLWQIVNEYPLASSIIDLEHDKELGASSVLLPSDSEVVWWLEKQMKMCKHLQLSFIISSKEVVVLDVCGRDRIMWTSYWVHGRALKSAAGLERGAVKRGRKQLEEMLKSRRLIGRVDPWTILAVVDARNGDVEDVGRSCNGKYIASTYMRSLMKSSVSWLLDENSKRSVWTDAIILEDVLDTGDDEEYTCDFQDLRLELYMWAMPGTRETRGRVLGELSGRSNFDYRMLVYHTLIQMSRVYGLLQSGVRV